MKGSDFHASLGATPSAAAVRAFIRSSKVISLIRLKIIPL
jgi:hypothetical protein